MAGERPANLRHGIGVARWQRGSLVAFLDSDDVWLPKKLEKQVPLFARDERLGFVHAQARAMDAGGQRHFAAPLGSRHAGDTLSPEELCLQDRIINGSVVVRKEALTSIGGFDSAVRFAEEWDLWLRVRR